MATPPRPEAWLRGPIDGIAAELQPVAHALVQARDEIRETISRLEERDLLARPGGVASISYHVRHLVGSTDRLFTYAAGRGLSDEQRAALADERAPGPIEISADELVTRWSAAVESCLDQLRGWPPETLLDARAVGAAKLPSTTIGLLFHAAEHAARHVGQIVTTTKLLLGRDEGKLE